MTSGEAVVRVETEPVLDLINSPPMLKPACRCFRGREAWTLTESALPDQARQDGSQHASSREGRTLPTYSCWAQRVQQ